MVGFELLFIPSPGIGHIRSTAAIAKLLVDSDDRLSITLIIIPSQFSGYVSSSFPESKDRLRYYPLPAITDQSTEHTFISYIESQKPQVKAAVSELSLKVSTSSNSKRLAGIVVDMFCTSMIDIADDFGLPAYTFYTSNASYLGLQFHIQSLYDDKKLNVSELKDSDVEFDVPTMTRPFPAKCLPSVMLSKDWFPYVLARAKILRATKGILVNSVAEMEPQALRFFSGENNTPPVYTVGPILELRNDGNEKQTEFYVGLTSNRPNRFCFSVLGAWEASVKNKREKSQWRLREVDTGSSGRSVALLR